MERWMKPVALVTTVQPYLLLWVLAITFFVCLTLIAVVSKGRTWKQLLGIFALCYVVLAITTVISTRFVVDIQVVDVEVISSAE